MLMPLYIMGAMGAGDVKLLGVAGAFVGPFGALIAGLATYIVGAIYGVLWILWHRLRPAAASHHVNLWFPELAALMPGFAGWEASPAARLLAAESQRRGQSQRAAPLHMLPLSQLASYSHCGSEDGRIRRYWGNYMNSTIPAEVSLPDELGLLRLSRLAPRPRSLEDTGLPRELVVDLLAKQLLDKGTPSLAKLADAMCLPGSIIEGLLDYMRSEALVEVRPNLGDISGLRYALTDRGRASALDAMLRSRFTSVQPQSRSKTTQHSCAVSRFTNRPSPEMRCNTLSEKLSSNNRYSISSGPPSTRDVQFFCTVMQARARPTSRNA